jgi:diaminopimelate epimerase
MRLTKSHALGNDYLVLDEGPPLDARQVLLLCDRHEGIGADGILEPVESPRADHGVRIWNPDGSLAEKSGNGLRIFARWLVEHRSAPRTFTVETASGVVTCAVDGERIAVAMGKATFEPAEIPCTKRLIDSPIVIGDATVHVTAVGMGNPHCVSFHAAPLDALPWRSWGAWLERSAWFPNRTNVQFARVVGRGRIEARIWERGAGETQASGSSACAITAAAVALGFTERSVVVEMPGGPLEVHIADDGVIHLAGPAEEIGTFEPSAALLRKLAL